MTSLSPILRVQNLVKHFEVRLGAFGEKSGTVHAVDGITFDVDRGETLSLVGESGCGKSTAGFAIARLHPPTAGEVFFEGRDIGGMTRRESRIFRRSLQVVFQDPYSTLDPRMTIGDAVAEPIAFHRLAPRREVSSRVATLLTDVGLDPSFGQRYPHELSGGQRQRVVIARALACEPRFLVCDEAVSALDVSVQAQIINLLQDLQEKHQLTYLFIAHDLAVVRHISTRVAVMYLGRLAELAPADALFSRPRHPYTAALLAAAPEPDPAAERSRKHFVLQGDVPNPLEPPDGCRFRTRCPFAIDRCEKEVPSWRQLTPGHYVACHRAEEDLELARAQIAPSQDVSGRA